MNLLTVKETAQLLRVSQITVRRYIASGELPAERVGRGIRIRSEALANLIVPIEPSGVNSKSRQNRELLALAEAVGGIIGIGRSTGPTSIAEQKDEYIADAILASNVAEEEVDPDDLLGKPFTFDDPLWNMMGIGSSDDSPDVATHKHKYLADAILSEFE